MTGVPRDTARTERPPLDGARLAQSLHGLWSPIRVVTETGSTNADVAEAALAGAEHGLALIAERQLAGRGRLGRSWQAPPGAGLTMSVLLRPRSVPVTRLGWLPLLAGVAVVDACRGGPDPVDAALKWPNDLLLPMGPGSAGWGKGGGVLAEVVAPDAIVVGIGVNVLQDAGELPPPVDPAAYPPTSLALAGAHGDRETLAVEVLRRLSHWYDRWSTAAGDPVASGLAAAYRAYCRTLGREVTVSLPGAGSLRGTAIDVDHDGRLVVRAAGSEHHLAAGDVHHVRDTPGPSPDQRRYGLDRTH